MSKVTEKLVLKPLNKHIDILKSCQTPDMDLNLSSTLHLKTPSTSTDETIPDWCCFEKAIDTIWINGLLHKLTILNSPLYIIKQLHSYFTDRNFTVQIDNTHSTVKQVTARVQEVQSWDYHCLMSTFVTFPLTPTQYYCLAYLSMTTAVR
ncbi:uncharacterized protein LOC113380302 [Ctenocephalides felis]|uniref:uncharacterized protein LOC113380302 n=1 Tax=Ctenocephalides felis TaxID=7515 RepID=UPI000E6E120D|nr:uncharacterized protein LOC113380302 [Ctenocephalides felis]